MYQFESLVFFADAPVALCQTVISCENLLAVINYQRWGPQGTSIDRQAHVCRLSK